MPYLHVKSVKDGGGVNFMDLIIKRTCIIGAKGIWTDVYTDKEKVYNSDFMWIFSLSDKIYLHLQQFNQNPIKGMLQL